MKKIVLFLGLVVSAMLFVGCASQPVVDKSAAAAPAQPAPVKAKDLKGESI